MKILPVRIITENMKKKNGFEGINIESVRILLKIRYETMERSFLVSTAVQENGCTPSFLDLLLTVVSAQKKNSCSPPTIA